MDISFFDPDRSHADHLASALATYAHAETASRKWRSRAYGVDVDWPRGRTPDDVRGDYDARLQAALQELREATPESDMESEDEGVMMAYPRAATGVLKRGFVPKAATVVGMQTPPTSSDDDEVAAPLPSSRKRRCGLDDGFGGLGGGGEAKRARRSSCAAGVSVCEEATCLESKSKTPRASPPKRDVGVPTQNRRISRTSRARRTEARSIHRMTTRSQARNSRNPG